MTLMSCMIAAEKVLWLIDNRDVSQADVARAMTVAPSRISEWRKRLADGERVTITTTQAFGAARLFGVSMDWLADDAQDVPPVAAELSDDMRVILAIVGDLGPKLARQRLTMAPAAGGAPPAHKQGDPVPNVTVEPAIIPTQAEAAEIMKRRRKN